MPRLRRASAFTAAAITVLTLAGCGDTWSQPHAAPTAVGHPAPGFSPTAAPAPESTVVPAARSWREVHPSPGYRVVLVTAGRDRATRAVTDAVTRWGRAEHVDLRTVDADGEHVDGIARAIAMRPDLVIGAGNRLVDALALVTASNPHQQFLIVGAEVAEPTQNVTAVDWTGAAFRGEGLGAPSAYDPATFTAARCDAALRAGIAAVLTQLTGVVLWIDCRGCRTGTEGGIVEA